MDNKTYLEQLKQPLNEMWAFPWLDRGQKNKIQIGTINSKPVIYAEVKKEKFFLIFFLKGKFNNLNRRGTILDGEVYFAYTNTFGNKEAKELKTKFVKQAEGTAKISSRPATFGMDKIDGVGKYIRKGTSLVIRQDQSRTTKIAKITNEKPASVYYSMKEQEEILQEVEPLTISLAMLATELALAFLIMWAIAQSGKRNAKLSKEFNTILKDDKRTWEVRVMKEDGPNAFCMITPKIFITTGLIKMMTHKELISVLLHEAGHIQNRDVIKSMSFSTFLKLLFIAGVQLAGGGMAAIVLGMIFVVINALGFEQFVRSRILGRRFENRADSWAVKYGYGKEMASALTKIGKWVDTQGAKRPCGKTCKIFGKIDAFLDEHPPIEKRVQKVLQQVETWKQGKNFIKLQSYFLKALMKG